MIETVGLTKEYRTDSGRVLALNDVSLKVLPGQRIGVLGRNGSGKSTLIRLIGRVELPTRGTVRRSMSVSWPLAYRGGFHLQLTGYENLRFLARVYDKSFPEMSAYVEDFTEMGTRLQDPVHTYSAGMRAKFSFGVSLAIEFDCYLIDEVLAVGDQQFRRKCKRELFEKRSDRAMLMVSHQPSMIRETCEFGLLIENGQCIDTFDIGSGNDWQKHAREN
jgi:capsular polysaccharide transport system ATP-binding protein